jgi:hypothetical protein
MNPYNKPIKHTAYETERFSLHDPIDGKSLCEKFAETLDSILGALQKSAKENGIGIAETRVFFESDEKDGHPSGFFRVIATGVEKEGGK